MNKEFGREIRMYEGKVYGCEVSKYGLEHGYLDYLTLSKIIGDCILNNTVRSETAEDWDTVSGEFDGAVFQDYIIHMIGTLGLNMLLSADRLESCGVINGRKLHTLDKSYI